MGAESGRPNPGLIERLHREPWRFDFRQAVRLLQWPDRAAGAVPAPVGRDELPEREAVRFRTATSLGFPTSPIVVIRPRRRNGDADGSTTANDVAQGQGSPDGHSASSSAPPDELYVTFLGLSGTMGALPDHYTTTLIEAARNKQTAIGSFFDLFNHRIVSLFYRVEEKYRFPLAFERAAHSGDTRSAFTMVDVIRCLAGMGSPGLQDRMSEPDDTALHFAGHFARPVRTAAGLARMLTGRFHVPVQVDQFRGQWLDLELHDRTRLPVAPRRGQTADRSARASVSAVGTNCALGVNTMVGQRAWDVQGRFRVRLGPLTYAQYCRFLPTGCDLHRLRDLVRLYVGSEFDFEVQPILKGDEIPMTRLPAAHDDAEQPAGGLGWNVWLASGDALDDFDGATLVIKDAGDVAPGNNLDDLGGGGFAPGSQTGTLSHVSS